jgi:hypothetical protein
VFEVFSINMATNVIRLVLPMHQFNFVFSDYRSS